MMPSQKRQRGRTNGEGASNTVPSGSDAPSRGKAVLAKRAAKKESRPTQRKRPETPGDNQMKEPCLRVTLPGDLYERSGQWWWRTKLPGENKAKARLLKASETDEAVCDRNTAEKIAVGMWEQAVRENETRQITRDCTEKVERLKAQFLDKVRQFTVIVESTNAKAQAEAQARVEIEARLNAMIQAVEQKTTAASSAPGAEPSLSGSLNARSVFRGQAQHGGISGVCHAHRSPGGSSCDKRRHGRMPYASPGHRNGVRSILCIRDGEPRSSAPNRGLRVLRRPRGCCVRSGSHRFRAVALPGLYRGPSHGRLSHRGKALLRQPQYRRRSRESADSPQDTSPSAASPVLIRWRGAMTCLGTWHRNRIFCRTDHRFARSRNTMP